MPTLLTATENRIRFPIALFYLQPCIGDFPSRINLQSDTTVHMVVTDLQNQRLTGSEYTLLSCPEQRANLVQERPSGNHARNGSRC